MDDHKLQQQLPTVVDAMVQSIVNEPRIQHLNRVFLPSRETIVQAIEVLRQIIYPGYFGQQGLTSQNIHGRLSELMAEVQQLLYEQVRCCLRYKRQIPSAATRGDDCDECDREADEIVLKFLQRLPAVRVLLSDDVQAAFDGDPAAQSTDETIFCYPGLLAITVQRLAHEFYMLDVPMMPRIMTEYAHSLTGIDIHPGAHLGRRFFIDHGTGIVIGETTQIGDNVKIYQGVTLGAIAPAFGQLLRGQKRHPTIENDVTIYAGATILGGGTTIGEGCTIGGNVFITASVPKFNQVTAEPPNLKYRDRSARQRADFIADYQI
jgi:serine O-acetyltransferase